MKAGKINLNKISFLLFTVFFTVNFTMADSLVKDKVEKSLAFDLTSNVSNFVKSTKEAVVNAFSKEEKIKVVEVLETLSEKKKVNLSLSTCELHDVAVVNNLTLVSNSSEAQVKIDKIQNTIDDEITVRENIFSNTNDKNLSSLQKKEKSVFKEMKEELDEATRYYQNIDEKTTETSDFLEENDCEDMGKVTVKALKNTVEETSNMLEEEGVFRKQFSASLKDKMLIIKKEVKEAQK